MTIEEIKELIQVVHDTGIAELEIQRGDNRVRIRRSMPNSQDLMVPTVVPVTVTAVTPGTVQQSISATPEAATLPAPAATVNERENDHAVTSPIVGTYYDAPAPAAPPFVKVGDRVEPKQVLCIIESMKLMNEIEAEIAGTLTGKFVENGKPVEYGEPLFTIRPL